MRFGAAAMLPAVAAAAVALLAAPLPAVMGQSTDQDVVDVLTSDHDRMRDMLTSLQEADGEEARTIMRQLRAALAVHTQAEEEIVYPAFRQCVAGDEGKEMFAQNLTEHSLVDVVLDQLGDVRSGTPEFRGRSAVLRDLVERHAETEEKEMFTTLRNECDDALLEELGDQVAKRMRMLEDHLDPSARSA